MTQRRILFVDDEPNIIEGLRRIFRRRRAEWHVEFVTSGAAALARMAASPFDVIVTDLKMPDMDGHTLLERVREHYPGTARIVLSGHTDEAMIRRALSAAHRYLAKPSDADTLTHAVEEACGAMQIVQDDRLRALLGGCDALPSAPDLYLDITRAAESEKSGAVTISRIISRDMAMSAKLLQLVNSSFFGIARRVSSVAETVALLGVTRIKALVVTEHIFREFAPPRQIPGLQVERLWRHSIRVAELAREFSRLEQQGGDRPDQAFTAGLLHDVGLLVLASQQPAALERLSLLARERNAEPQTLEREVLGATHAEVGAYILRLWGLPARIVEAVGLHHTPREIDYDGLCAVTVVHAADVLEQHLEEEAGGRPEDIDHASLDDEYLRRVGMAERFGIWRERAGRLVSREAVHTG